MEVTGRNRRSWRVFPLYHVFSSYLAIPHNYNHFAHVYNLTSTCYHQAPRPETMGSDSAVGDGVYRDPSPGRTCNYTSVHTWSAYATFCPWTDTVSAARPCDRITRRISVCCCHHGTVQRIGHPGFCHPPARPFLEQMDSILPLPYSWTLAWVTFDFRVGSATFRLLKLQNAYSLGACKDKKNSTWFVVTWVVW